MNLISIVFHVDVSTKKKPVILSLLSKRTGDLISLGLENTVWFNLHVQCSVFDIHFRFIFVNNWRQYHFIVTTDEFSTLNHFVCTPLTYTYIHLLSKTRRKWRVIFYTFFFFLSVLNVVFMKYKKVYVFQSGPSNVSSYGFVLNWATGFFFFLTLYFVCLRVATKKLIKNFTNNRSNILLTLFSIRIVSLVLNPHLKADWFCKKSNYLVRLKSIVEDRTAIINWSLSVHATEVRFLYCRLNCRLKYTNLRLSLTFCRSNVILFFDHRNSHVAEG